jgi:hypothetical protein
MNPCLYAEANPVNRADPSGRFGNDAIVRSFGVTSFEQVMDFFEETGGRWGLLRLLQDAQEGDALEIGYEGKPAPEIKTQPNHFTCQSGRIELEYGCDLKCFVESLQGARFRLAQKWWRATGIDWYFLNGGGPGKDTPSTPSWWKGGYTDWKDWTNLPDFVVIGYGNGFVLFDYQVSGVVDRYGRLYAGWSLGLGASLLPVDISYAEGYIGQYNNYVLRDGGPIITKSEPASRQEVESFLSKSTYGETLWGSGGPGIGGSASTDLTGSAGGACVLFGFGVPGVSWTAGQTYLLDPSENPELAWDWLDRTPMIGRSDISADNKLSECGCQ